MDLQGSPESAFIMTNLELILSVKKLGHTGIWRILVIKNQNHVNPQNAGVLKEEQICFDSSV